MTGSEDIVLDKAQTHEQTGGHGDSVYTPNFLTRGKGVGGYKTHRQQTVAEGRETDRQTDRMTDTETDRDTDTDRQTDRQTETKTQREKGGRWEDGYKNSDSRLRQRDGGKGRRGGGPGRRWLE